MKEVSLWIWQLNCAVRQENGNSIDDGIVAATALAMNASCISPQVLMAGGADDPAQVLGGR
jgi:hypothetical protein